MLTVLVLVVGVLLGVLTLEAALWLETAIYNWQIRREVHRRMKGR